MQCTKIIATQFRLRSTHIERVNKAVDRLIRSDRHGQTIVNSTSPDFFKKSGFFGTQIWALTV